MNTIYIVPIEPIDQRYTKQWYDNIPVSLQDATSKYNIVTIDGETIADKTTDGAFLDFAATNIYKSSQITAISKLFNEGHIIAGDKFLVTDAWNYAVIAIRYMSDLLGIPVEIHSIWHAGAYDPTDILGMKMQKPWPWNFEKSVYYASDFNYFATDFHKNMFLKNLEITDDSKAIRSGQPHSLIIGDLLDGFLNEKYNTIIFPHRLNSDKQPEIMKDLLEDFPTIITQYFDFTKEQYYDVLSECKVVFSCSLHENLGISMMEGTLSGCIPVVPDRASYSEMYLDCFKYPSEWTSSYDKYLENKEKLSAFIQDKIDNYDAYTDRLLEQAQILVDKYLTATIMVDNLIK